MKVTGPVFYGRASAFSVHCLSHYMRGSLKRGTLWIKGTVNGAQIGKRAVTKP